MKLVDGWQQCWRWYSIHALAISAAVPAAWAAMNDQFPSIMNSVPHWIEWVLISTAFVCGVVGRLIVQQTPGGGNI